MNVLFDVYDSIGGVEVGDSDVTVVFDTTRHLNDHASLEEGEINLQLPSSIVTPPTYNTILFFSRASIYVSSGTNRSQSKSWIEIDTGSGYELVAGSESYGYNRTSTGGYSTIAMCTTVHLDKTITIPVKFRIRAKRISGSNTLNTVAVGSTLTGIMDM